jgi:hypothetical protein
MAKASIPEGITPDDIRELLKRLRPEERRLLLNELSQMSDMSRVIPGGITLDHYLDIRKLLLSVLRELKDLRGASARQVVLRLNETGKEEAAPVFVGWVEDSERIKTRLAGNSPEPGLLRFGDTSPSTTYERCFYNGGDLFERDWMISRHFEERKGNELCLSQKAGVSYLRVIGVVVSERGERRCVGLLGAGFSKKPDSPTLAEVDGILERWAHSEDRELVPYLKMTFVLGGRILQS